jgi:hypothetical protein
MTEQFTLALPATVLEGAKLVAGRSGRPVDAVLIEALERAFEPLGKWAPEPPVAQWSDQEVLDAADSRMPEREDDRLSELLDLQQAGKLHETQRGELDALLEMYKRGSLRKSEALVEAVRRGLREPPQP